jgi:hypothetical protein
MLHAFLDEAGTAPKEPVRVVAGIIVPHDLYLGTRNFVERIYDTFVPQHFRSGFVFHASALMHDDEYRDGWPLLGEKGRLALVNAMLGTPGFLGFRIVWAATRNGCPVDPVVLERVSDAQFGHISAFLHCIGVFDRYLGELSETGTVCVEQVKLQGRLNDAYRVMREQPIPAPDRYCYFGPNEIVPAITKLNYKFENSRIVESPAFLRKDETLLPLADAVCFGLRSFLSETQYGESYAQKLFHNDPRISEIKETGKRSMACGFTDWSTIQQSEEANRMIAEFMAPRAAA